jgi:hypothetical protein
VVKGIYAGENSTAEICTEVAYFLSSYAEESEGRTSGVVEVETVPVNAIIAVWSGGGMWQPGGRAPPIIIT